MAGSSARKKTPKAAAKPAAPTTSGVESVSPLNLADIKELFVLMRQNEIAELQLEQDKTKIHIVSKGAHMPAASVVPMMASVPQMVSMHAPPAPQQVLPATQTVAAESAPTAPAAGPGGDSAVPSNYKTIYSPMVGTFYSSPAPDAPPFVRAGDTINEETVLCIIEAMKLMNEIKAEMKGRIHKILVENGVPVEFNQPLFLIEP